MLKFFITLTFSLSLYAQNIIWNTVEFPPSLITKGPLKNQGFSDKARIFIVNHLKEFNHKLRYTNSARAINNLKSKKNHCFSGLNKNSQREDFVYFSKPFMYSLPQEIIIKNENLKKFKTFINQEGLIDLEQLLQDKKFQLAYTKERSYSTHIDKLILKYHKNSNLAYRPATDLTNGFLRMLQTNRVDYIIEYPVMVSYLSKDTFISIPIKNSNTRFPVYIGCSKSPKGKKIIEKINTIINENQEVLKGFFASYLNSNTKKRYLNSVQK